MKNKKNAEGTKTLTDIKLSLAGFTQLYTRT